MYSLMTFLLVVAIMQTCFQFLQCRPFWVFWDASVFKWRRVKCFPRGVIDGNVILFSTVHVSVDLIFTCIPITFIARLNRPRRERAFMCVLMGLGLFASVAAIVRTMHLKAINRSNDGFRSAVSIALWAVIEMQFALIAATMPTLKAFLERTLLKLGMFFYDEKTESEVKSVLVQYGFLEEPKAKKSGTSRNKEDAGVSKERKKDGKKELDDDDDDEEREKEFEKELESWRGFSEGRRFQREV